MDYFDTGPKYLYHINRDRYLKKPILEDLNNKMVFIGGARQVGKTTLSLDPTRAEFIHNTKRAMGFAGRANFSAMLYQPMGKHNPIFFWNQFL